MPKISKDEQLDYHRSNVCWPLAYGRGTNDFASSFKDEGCRTPQWKQNGTEGASLEDYNAAEGAGLRAFFALSRKGAAAPVGEARLYARHGEGRVPSPAFAECEGRV